MRIRAINEPFACAACGRAVEPPRKGERYHGTIRNHCPRCLASLHVDGALPGDRTSACRGVMDAVDVRLTGHKGEQLLHRCRRCGKEQWNKVAKDDDRAAVEAVAQNKAA